MSTQPDEFALIAELFAPLAASYPGALGLTDDAALLEVPDGQQLVVTVDAMVAGVHFLPDDPPDLVARKLIRVNLSDLAAKGAVPFAVLLAASFPTDVSMAWLTTFAAGLKQDVESYAIALIGGDTVSTPGPLTLSLTAFGRVEAGRALLRRHAQVGDRLWVSGTIGDGALGLLAAQGGLLDLSAEHRDALADRYRLPRPRSLLGPRLVGVARAAMDVSDGLVQDLGHLCRASGVGAVVEADKVPLSAAARAVVAADQSRLATVLTGGDDYELLFTAPREGTDLLLTLARETDTSLTEIGCITAGTGVTVLDRDGQAVLLPRQGWRHFRGEPA
ncbi:thiamine-phosphate kinase [Magnetospirillum moscoviense]|uniref:Thiamine-monophosphate kinase n=1 Tax=Magnetospirillum moscoviense TaxID=1437059 RepID=A0A178MP83_9PROT|nr:thiamine-phosphate kinase [Magnetospirillum moscoviense]OAN50622.1 thiamine-phosphate kinase [Magnetospirillum moscoviense]